MKPRIKLNMEIKQATLLLLIFFSLVLVSSSSKALHSEKLQGNKIGLRRIEDGKYSADEHISATSHASGHGGSSGGGTGGGRGDTGGDTGSDPQKPAGASNVNHHRRGGSMRVQSSVFLTWVVAIFATQFSTQVL